MKKPPDMKPGSLITHGYLNSVRDYGVKGVRVGPGMVGNLSGGMSAFALAKKLSPRVGYRPWYYAKVTASSASVPELTLAELDSSGDVIMDGRAPEDATTLDERKGVPVDTPGLAFELAPTSAGGDPVTKFVYQQPASFGIKLTQTGGSAGNATTQCSFTYTVKDMLDNELATGVNPTSAPHLEVRPTVGFRIAAKAGVATFETGELVILTTNETDDMEACE